MALLHETREASNWLEITTQLASRFEKSALPLYVWKPAFVKSGHISCIHYRICIGNFLFHMSLSLTIHMFTYCAHVL